MAKENKPSVFDKEHSPLDSPDEKAAALGAAWLAIAVFALAYNALENIINFNR